MHHTLCSAPGCKSKQSKQYSLIFMELLLCRKALLQRGYNYLGKIDEDTEHYSHPGLCPKLHSLLVTEQNLETGSAWPQCQLLISGLCCSNERASSIHTLSLGWLE